MLTFLHAGHPATVSLGDKWQAPEAKPSYQDTASSTLRSIIREVEQGTPWRDAVGSRYQETHSWLHRIVTSPARSLFFRQHPPPPGARILDIGAGWGQIALPLAQDSSARVTALEPTPERLDFIHAAARQERVAERMYFVQADFLDVEFSASFDLICCIGVLEWVPKFRAGPAQEVQREFMRRIRASLRPGGRCCVGIENRLGLKYLLGAKDDHTGQRSVSVLDAALATTKHRTLTGEELRVFTYSHAEYLELFRAAGFTAVESHGAFPDYKLPELILPFDSSDSFNARLQTGAIPPEHDGQDGQVLPQAEEYASHYRSLAGMKLAQYFAPSFFFMLQ